MATDRKDGRLQAAVESAVASTAADLDRLAADVGLAFKRARAHAPKSPELKALDRSVTQALRAHRRDAGTFRVVLFGRTGSGKSSLIEALTGGDGRSISPGDSDWTTAPRGVGWGPLELVDTPGVGGYGRTQSRESLESIAAREVSRADLVLLAFDDSNQQESEFEQVRREIRAYGRPCLAVLNVRNPRWRDRTHTGRSATVQRHVNANAAHVRRQLDALGLAEVPIIAINSQRAVAARAGADYAGPDAELVRGRRDAIGPHLLEELSNLTLLETLLSECLGAAAPQLRAAAVEADVLGHIALGCASLTAHADDLEQEVDGAVHRLLAGFAVIGAGSGGQGCWGRSESQAKHLTLLEDLRPELLAGARREGTLQQAARQLHSIHLAPHRRKLYEAADEIAHGALADKADVEAMEVVERLRPAMQAAQVATENALEEVSREFEQQLVGIDLALQALAGDVKARAIRGKRKETGRKVWTTAEVGASFGFAAAVLLASNPVGWVAGAGMVVVGWFTSRKRKQAAKRAEERAVRMRTEAVKHVREAADSVFSTLSEYYWSSISSAADSTARELLTRDDPCALVASQERQLGLRLAVGELSRLAPVHPWVESADALKAAVERTCRGVPRSPGQDPLLGALAALPSGAVAGEQPPSDAASLVAQHRARAAAWLSGLPETSSDVPNSGRAGRGRAGLIGANGVGLKTLARALRNLGPRDVSYRVLTPAGVGSEQCDVLLWVFSVNGTAVPALAALVGETSLVRDAVLARSAFVMTRLDQLGPDLQREPEHVTARLEGKTREVADLLSRHGVAVDASSVMCCSAAPFGERITPALRSLTGVQELADAVRNACDRVRPARERHALIHRTERELALATDYVRRLATERAAVEEEVSTLARGVAALDRAVGDGEARVRNAVGDLVEGMALAVCAAQTNESMQAALKRLRNWRADDEVEAALASWESAFLEEMRTLNRELRDDLADLHRRLATDSTLKLRAPGKRDGQLGRTSAAVSQLLKEAGRSRDRYYNLVKFISGNKIKFKPWGAIKGARHAAKLAKGLAVLAAVVTLVEVVADAKARKERERLRATVIGAARTDVEEALTEHLWGAAAHNVPSGILRQWSDRLDGLRGEVQNLRAVADELDDQLRKAESGAARVEDRLKKMAA